jgi:hypothetical protein
MFYNFKENKESGIPFHQCAHFLQASAKNRPKKPVLSLHSLIFFA